MGLRPVERQAGLRAPSQSFLYTSRGERVDTPVAAPGPAIILAQTGIDVVPANNLSLSGLTLGAGPILNIDMRPGGSSGGNFTVRVSTKAIRAHVFMTTPFNEPNQVLWDAGPWTVRVNVSGFIGNNARIRTCHICRVDSLGVSKGLIGSVALNIPCSNGVKSWTVQGVESDGLLSDRVHIVIGMSRLGVGNVFVRIRQNQNVDTPILTRAA